DLNETAAQKPWLEETTPGSGLFTFSFAGLANFKSKVMEMVAQKNKYLAERALLRQQMAEALFNRSVPYFQTMQSNFTDGGVDIEPFSVIQRIFGLGTDKPIDDDNVNEGKENGVIKQKDSNANSDNEDSAAAVTEISGDAIIDSALTLNQAEREEADKAVSPAISPIQTGKSTRFSEVTETTTKYPWGRWKAVHKNMWWNSDAAKKRQDFIQAKIQKSIEKRQMWERFASERFSGQEAHATPWGGVQSPPVGDGSEAHNIQDQGGILEDIKEKLRDQFESAITKLNESRNAFLKAKEDMAQGAAGKPWEKPALGGGTTFDPAALMSFKAKIHEMVTLKNQYVAERAALKQEMLTTLRDLLLEHLAQLTESEESPGSQELATPEGTPDTDLNAILQELIDTDTDAVDADVTEGLPFAQSLMLAAAPQGPPSGSDHVTGESGGSGSFAALITMGVVAVVATVVVVGGIMLKKAGRRSLYSHLA
ncbi:hypothetical protein EGW08_013465, partial [Elysia chlorotica]